MKDSVAPYLLDFPEIRQISLKADDMSMCSQLLLLL